MRELEKKCRVYRVQRTWVVEATSAGEAVLKSRHWKHDDVKVTVMKAVPRVTMLGVVKSVR